MLTVDIPDDERLLDLLNHRHPASATIVLGTSPMPAERERARSAMRAAIDDVDGRLAQHDVSADDRRAVVAGLRALLDDDLWSHLSRSLIAVAAPDRAEAFRLPFALDDRVTVCGRFAVRPLLLTRDGQDHVYVLQLSRGIARLTELTGDRVVEHPLDLPEDHGMEFVHAENEGRLDRDRARGADGDRSERERFCRTVQDAVARLVPRGTPLILAATDELEPAYRAQNTHDALLEAAIAVHPESLDDRRLADEAGAILDSRHREATERWKDRFGMLRSQGLATSRVKEVAAAAAAAAVEELRFDVGADVHGRVDDFGRVAEDGDSPLVEDVVALVLASGGKVRAVRRGDLTDGAPLAATLRFTVPTPA